MRPEDPGQRRAWRVLGAAMLLTLGASLLGWRLGEASGPLAAAAAVTWTLAWLLTVRFRFLSLRRPRAATVFLAAVWALTLGGPEGLRLLGLIAGILFMVQRHQSFRVLGSRRRMHVFLLGGPLLALTFAGGFTAPDGAAGDVLRLCRLGLQAFWISTLCCLLIGMRLHFLRLRPKLLVTGVLVGVIPLVLLSVFGLVLLYGALGGGRANRARDVLQEAALTYHEGRAPDLLTAAPSTWDERRPGQGPDWAAGLVAALRRHRQDPAGLSVPAADAAADAPRQGGVFQLSLDDGEMDGGLAAIAAAADTTAWVRTDEGYWLVRWRDPAPGSAVVEAIPFDRGALGRLARMVRADIQARSTDGAGTIEVTDDDGTPSDLASRYGAGRTDPDGGWPQRPRYFGTTMVPAVHLTADGLGRGYIWLTLQTSLADLAREFASTEAALNIVILIVLGVIAVVFLLASLTALVFSLRITGGITGAVKALHRGTQRLAGGDLDVEIELENEDEFGDLADSFNAMTAAVKKGREDAVARERLQQEMQTARRIQERLLPHDEPVLAGWQVTGLSLPSLQVGGDYFDFLPVEPGRLGLAIGDVSGKGMPAALLMSNLQASLKGQLLSRLPVAEVVGRINRLLSTSTDAHMFATFIYGELDPVGGVFTCANAGHEPPLLVRRDGSVHWLATGGLLLGMLSDRTYEPTETRLEPGDVLVLYTDGITEAGAPIPTSPEERADDDADDPDNEFGEERLAAVVVAARERSALGIREAILAEVQRHLGDRAPGDDITLVVVKRTDRPEAPGTAG